MSALTSAALSHLPKGLEEAVETAALGRLENLKRHTGGGASREGGHVDLIRDGDRIPAFLAFDVRREGDADRVAYARREAAALALAETAGLRSPGVLASLPERRAILMRAVAGVARLDDLPDEAQGRLARDYVAELARLHRIPVTAEQAAPLGGLRSPSTYAREETVRLKVVHMAAGRPDPLLMFLYDWLERNAPTGEIPAVVVHGDAGPGNFLHDGQVVTAMLDWELAHIGDPMEDFAWIAIRSTMSAFAPLPELYAAYEEAGGFPIDRDRIRYWRLFCQAGVLTDQHRSLFQSAEPFAGAVGSVMIFHYLHRRLAVEALMEASGLGADFVPAPVAGDPAQDRFYALALEDMRTNVIGRIDDTVANHRAKAMVRQIKYWRGRQRYGAAFDEAERAEIANLLESRFDDLALAQTAFAQSIANGGVSDEQVLSLLQRRVSRETIVAGEMMGAFAQRHYGPLD